MVKHQEFLALHADQLATLLKSDDLNVVTEENVFESLMTWVQHDSENRKQHLPTLLKLIKLPLLSSEVCITTCNITELVNLSLLSSEIYVLIAISYHLLNYTDLFFFSVFN